MINLSRVHSVIQSLNSYILNYLRSIQDYTNTYICNCFLLQLVL